MRVLITGGRGNLASMIKNNLSSIFDIINPSHSELDLTDCNALSTFLEKNGDFDILVHTAILGGRRTKSENYDIVFKNLLMIENILKFSDKFKMIINFDSAAIYDRSTDILNRKEEDMYTVPNDYYGFSKYVIYKRSLQYSHFYNLRVFNIFHVNEEPDRFIKSCFLSKKNNTKVTIFNDKYFDFVYETDFIKIIHHYFSNAMTQDTLEKTLNICYEKKYTLSQIANKIVPPENVEIIDTALTYNYSGDNTKLKNMHIELDGLEKSLLLYQENLVL
uniref:NAD-dependent epimerase/dehydratase domain-containing protein n=1 Tax=viral metagenome TaxID=1070528 RepID=A0A6C0AT19_9ZZZZ